MFTERILSVLCCMKLLGCAVFRSRHVWIAHVGDCRCVLAVKTSASAFFASCASPSRAGDMG